MDGVKEAHRIVSPYKLASRSFRPAGTVVRVGDVDVGGERVVVMAGRAAWRAGTRSSGRRKLWPAGRQVIRAGAFKRAARPTPFQGLGEKGLRMLRAAADRHGLLVVSEVMDLTRSRWWRSTPTSCKWARATCRASPCCASWASCASRCCSSAVFRLPLKSCCSRPNTFSRAATTT